MADKYNSGDKAKLNAIVSRIKNGDIIVAAQHATALRDHGPQPPARMSKDQKIGSGLEGPQTARFRSSREAALVDAGVMDKLSKENVHTPTKMPKEPGNAAIKSIGFAAQRLHNN